LKKRNRAEETVKTDHICSYESICL